jgi:hypothetical protein
MLIIREEQLAVLNRVQTNKFEDAMLAHLKKFFPKKAKAGEPKLKEAIQHGIKQAGAHGIVSERDVCKYIDLMMVFGKDFDADEKLPWAAEILEKEQDPEEKMAALMERADKQLKKKQKKKRSA